MCRNDGQTLNGAINSGFDQWVQRFNPEDLTFFRTYFGNIDIRHHLCRIYNSRQEQVLAVKNLVQSYFEELVRIKNKYSIENVEVVATLPIENESRRLPKTGYYKGKPFWGSWSDRNYIHMCFNSFSKALCEELNFKFIEWPEYFLNEEKELGFEYMERPRSVHVSPRHYMWKAFSDD